LAEALKPIPGSGPCQVTGMFSLDEAAEVNTLVPLDNLNDLVIVLELV
jgi:hypothetical protein